MTTLRDLKEAYVIERDELERKQRPFNSTLRGHRDKFFKDNAEALEVDFWERGRDNYDVGLVSSWNDKAMNYAIEQVDWDELNQCNTCHKYFNWLESDSDDQRFCSDGCEEAYEEVPDREER